MADVGIRRPVEFESVFEKLKENPPKGFALAEKLTEIVVFAAYVGFHFKRTGNGPYHRPVEWKYFSADEKNRLFVLAIAHTKRAEGKASPNILSKDRQQEMFKLLEQYVHGGLLELREKNVFSTPTEEGYGQGLATFVKRALEEDEDDTGEIRVQDLLRDLRSFEQ
ncbi:MAG TPA: hypothetical protein VFF73_14160 [Planctomycetota bacterium]|nr:hypothetical protein [Planctomycetota bacterium]